MSDTHPGLTAEMMSRRPDPGPAFPLFFRIWWQHTPTWVSDTDLAHLRDMPEDLDAALFYSGSIASPVHPAAGWIGADVQ